VITAASLTSSPTSLFWLTVVLAIVAIAAGIVAFLTLRAGRARKRLLFSIISRSQLLAAPVAMRDDLQIRYQEEELNNPHVVAIELANTGTSFIGSDAFDNKRSLQFDVKVPIIKVLTVEHTPTSAPAPVITAEGSTIELHPELIAKDESIKASILTEGQVDAIDVAFKPFGDVTVEIRDRDAWLAQRSRLRAIGLSAVAIAITAGLTAFSIVTAAQSNKELGISDKAAADANCGDVFSNVQSTGLALEFLSAEIFVSKSKAGSVKAISFPSNYHSIVKAFDVEARNTMASYRLAEEAGLALGRSASIPAQISQVMTILGRLPHEGASTRAYDDYKRLSVTANLLSSKQAMPPACS
jgi:hypothetical protein